MIILLQSATIITKCDSTRFSGRSRESTNREIGIGSFPRRGVDTSTSLGENSIHPVSKLRYALLHVASNSTSRSLRSVVHIQQI